VVVMTTAGTPTRASVLESCRSCSASSAVVVLLLRLSLSRLALIFLAVG
jgi:hypothetical protein